MKITFTIPILSQKYRFVNLFRKILEKHFKNLLIYLVFPGFFLKNRWENIKIIFTFSRFCENSFHFFHFCSFENFCFSKSGRLFHSQSRKLQEKLKRVFSYKERIFPLFFKKSQKRYLLVEAFVI